MKTNNERWNGNSNSGAGRDGKPFEKRDVKSILKGSRGAGKFNSERPANERSSGYSNYERDENRSYNNERRPYESRPNYGPRKPWENNDGGSSYGERRSYNRDNNGEHRSYNRDNNGEHRSYNRDNNGEHRSYNRDNNGGERRTYNRDNNGGERRSYNRDNNGGERPSYNRKPWDSNNGGSGERNYNRQPRQDSRPSVRVSFRKPGEEGNAEFVETRFEKKRERVVMRKPKRSYDGNYDENAKYSNRKQLEFRKNTVDLTQPVRLNKFLANAGICSRREADEYIQAGVITVNGEVVSELGVKVLPTDKIMFHDQPVRSERKVYLLLNKPKDCVTTAEDTHDRLTVLDLVKNACSERIYPVGRLDRNTTGVLLLTNDGDLASKLTHPKYDKKKIYHATLDKPLEREHFEQILAGVELDDTNIAADALEYVKDSDLKQVGIEIHSGQNRVVRRIFEKIGYKVIRLDRVFFAGLTKKNLPRGKYRFLNPREISMLKMGAHE